MMLLSPSRSRVLRAAGVGVTALLMASATSAAPVIFNVDADFSTNPFSFSYGDSSFIFSGTGDIFGPTAVQTGGTGQVNTIFGQPTTNFANRSSVIFGPNDQYAAFPTATPIRFSNGANIIGLSATSGADTFYGFAYTVNNLLSRYGFESTPGAPINATAAVPEPATWAMMALGFGFVGAAARRRRLAPANA